MPGDVSFTAAERKILGLSPAGISNKPSNLLAEGLKKKKKPKKKPKKKKPKGIAEGMADLIQSLRSRGR